MLRTALCCLCAVVSSADSINAQKKDQPPTRNRNYERKEFANSDGEKLVYYIMTPINYDANRKYPLVLALHGRGGNTTAAGVLGGEEMRETYPCFVMAPTSPKPLSWTSQKGGEKARIMLALEALDAVIKEVSIDADRLYVTGQSMGGYGSFGAIATRPNLFAAAVPVCGGWRPQQAKRMAKVPIWIFHGADDSVVPTSNSQRMVKALTEAGGKPKYTEYPGVKHNSWTKAYATREMWKWMFSQRRVAR